MSTERRSEFAANMKEGTYAEGVQGVVPTVTYPSHTNAGDGSVAGEAWNLCEHAIRSAR